MTDLSVGSKPKGLMLALAYAIAIPVWILSAPLMMIGGLSAWATRKRKAFSDTTPAP